MERSVLAYKHSRKNLTAIRNFEDYLWSLKCEIEKFMFVLTEKLNTTFTAELPPDISANVCRNFFTMDI